MRIIETADGFDQHRDNGLVFEDDDGYVFQYETLTDPVCGEPWISSFGCEMPGHPSCIQFPIKVLREGKP